MNDCIINNYNAKAYVLLAEQTNTKLERDINLMISEGWRLYGYTWVHDGIFFQAMITDTIPEQKKKKSKRVKSKKEKK